MTDTVTPLTYRYNPTAGVVEVHTHGDVLLLDESDLRTLLAVVEEHPPGACLWTIGTTGCITLPPRTTRLTPKTVAAMHRAVQDWYDEQLVGPS